MANIGGNITGIIQTKASEGKNAIGEAETVWTDTFSCVGWLGLQSGENKRASFNAKLEESSHVFLTDFNADIYALADSDTRMILKGNMYDVLLIDNPDEMDEQLEIYLRKVGGQYGKK
mgnify:CR=1 FL=1